MATRHTGNSEGIRGTHRKAGRAAYNHANRAAKSGRTSIDTDGECMIGYRENQ